MTLNDPIKPISESAAVDLAIDLWELKQSCKKMMSELLKINEQEACEIHKKRGEDIEFILRNKND